jgi:alkaline phosphatase
MHPPSLQLLRALRTSITKGSKSTGSLCATPTRIQLLSSFLNHHRNYSNGSSNFPAPIRPTRMVSRSHPAKPRSHDRGPQSQEDTQTDFAALNVLGNIPAPTTAVDACLDSGFHLDNGVKITDGDGVLLVGGEAFSWRPWKGNKGGEKSAMVNAKGQFEVDEQSWGVLDLVWPRPGMSCPWFSYISSSCPRIKASNHGRSIDIGNGSHSDASISRDEEAHQLSGNSS